ncbi:MAG: dual specificity protein phosphatase family protein [Nitrospirota bacterium]
MSLRKSLKNYRKLNIVIAILLVFIMLSGTTYPAPPGNSGGIIDKKDRTIDGQSVRPGTEVILPDGARASERVFGLKGLSNVGRVTPVIYRGAQPGPEGYETLRKMGIKTVVNLRTSLREKKYVEAAGMKSAEIPLSVFKDVNVSDVNRIIDIMTDTVNQPVYVHCRQGQDRTGIVIAAYRMRVEGWSLKDAESEMQEFGFNDIWRELKEFIREYAKSIGK